MKLPKGLFMTGTDTDVGKTWSTVALMRALQRQGHIVAGMKPVAAGCIWTEAGLRNQDALLLQQHASRTFDYDLINPYAFEAAVSPHSARGDVEVSLGRIVRAHELLKSQVDVLLLEGAGGWYSPLSQTFDNAQLAMALQLPVIIVVGMRLGCINHALLTWRAVRSSALPCAGWIAVTLDADMPAFGDNLAFLQASIDAPLLGVLPHLLTADFDALSNELCVLDMTQNTST